jgi:hypothetical protein
MAVARLRQTAPSELLRIGCDWCAYVLDEAMLVREVAHSRRLTEEANAESKQQATEDHYEATGRVKF